MFCRVRRAHHVRPCLRVPHVHKSREIKTVRMAHPTAGSMGFVMLPHASSHNIKAALQARCRTLRTLPNCYGNLAFRIFIDSY